VSVITAYAGAGALQVEQNVTEPLENLLSAIPNLEEIRSNSLDNLSVITLEFAWGVDMLEVSDNVRDAISRARQLLPADADEPFLQKFDSGAIPVLILSATADDSFANLEKILEDEVVTPLNRISGVGAVTINGAPVRQIHVLLDPDRFDAYNLDIQQVAQILAAENVVVPAGTLDLGTLTYNIRSGTEFQSETDIGNVIVAYQKGQAVYLREVARIVPGLEEETTITRIDGRHGAILIVNKQSDANAVSVAAAIHDRLPAIRAALPPDVNLSVVIDTSDFISNSINNLSSVLLFALIFVILVVLVFLHRWRATIIIAVTIPVSLVVAFIYLNLTGNTLNVISLSSLAIALGMVVDDAIVVLENVMKKVGKGIAPKQAAVEGTSEVFTAVIASTLTVVAVFLPLTFLGGMMGIWFSQLGLIVVVTVVTSTVAALSLTPMLASVMIREVDRHDGTTAGFMERFSARFEKAFLFVENLYGSMVRGLLEWKKTVLVCAIALFAASFLLLPMIGTEFMPEADNSRMEVTAELMSGRSLDFTRRVIAEMEQVIRDEVPEMSAMTMTAGGVDMRSGATGTYIITSALQLVPLAERDRSVFQIAEILRSRFADIPAVVRFRIRTGGGPGSDESPVQVHVLGQNLDETKRVAEDLAERMRTIPGLRDIAISRGDMRPELEIDFDRDRLADFGINSISASTGVRARMAGLTATRYRIENHEYDIILRQEEAARQTIADVANISLRTPSGRFVRVNDIAEIREIMTPPNVERMDRDRLVTVSSELHDRNLNEAADDIRRHIAGMPLPPRVEVLLGGDIEEQREAFADLFMVLGISLLLIYIVMAGQFESFRDPLVIMFSVPFAFSGVLVAFLLTGFPISVIGLVGGIILVGIVVKNAIVLIDYIRLLRSRGNELNESIVQAGILRLRPVLMTTLTTVLAMVPLALASGEGAETWRPMAIAVIGGLSFSTLVTLMLIPVMYSMFHRRNAC
ncbi:MAG TPA: efflux RND transporter permease subunit, partial [Acidobacteriota bacterium]|nr:efflux RND transporter permease subunit [Acidobacteriota bacterium]